MIVQQIPSFQVLCVDLPEKKRNNPRHNRDFLLGIKEESTTEIVLKILECSVCERSRLKSHSILVIPHSESEPNFCDENIHPKQPTVAVENPGRNVPVPKGSPHSVFEVRVSSFSVK